MTAVPAHPGSGSAPFFCPLSSKSQQLLGKAGAYEVSRISTSQTRRVGVKREGGLCWFCHQLPVTVPNPFPPWPSVSTPACLEAVICESISLHLAPGGVLPVAQSPVCLWGSGYVWGSGCPPACEIPEGRARVCFVCPSRAGPAPLSLCLTKGMKSALGGGWQARVATCLPSRGTVGCNSWRCSQAVRDTGSFACDLTNVPGFVWVTLDICRQSLCYQLWICLLGRLGFWAQGPRFLSVSTVPSAGPGTESVPHCVAEEALPCTTPI